MNHTVQHRAMDSRWSLVDGQGRILGGIKLLDVLLGLGLAVILLALWQVYGVLFDRMMARWAAIFLPSPVHITANAFLAVVIACIVLVGQRRAGREALNRWSVRTALIAAGLWVWGIEVIIAYMVYIHWLPSLLYTKTILLNLTVYGLALNGTWFTWRLRQRFSPRNVTL